MPTGDPLVCAAILRAVSTVAGLDLREIVAVAVYGTHTEVGQPSTAALVQAAVDCSQAVAGGTGRLAWTATCARSAACSLLAG